MQIKLNKIILENFKCFKFKEIDLGCKNAQIRAENGVGKTTAIPDAVLWLLFDKNSAGRTDFKNRPIVTNPVSLHYGEAIKGLTVAVEAELEINGEVHMLRREERERINKNQIEGFTSYYWIDEVPQKPQRLYHEYIENIMPKDKLKIFTDLDYFNDDKKNPWDNRRKTLRDMAGATAEPTGFDELKAELKGRKIKEYEKILKDQKKAYEEEQEKIPTQIGENQRKIKEYVQNTDTITLQAKRENLQDKIGGLITKLNDLLNDEKNRQNKNEKINQLIGQRLHRESVVKNQSGPVDALLEERSELERKHADKKQELVELQNLISQGQTAIKSVQNQIDQSQRSLQCIRDEYNKIEGEPTKDTCYACGQKLPADKMAENLNKRETRLAKITEDGKKVKTSIVDCTAKKDDLQNELNKLMADEKVKIEELKQAEENKNKRIAEINEAIENRPEPDPAEDQEWQKINSEIEKVKAEIGAPVSKQLEAIEAKKKTAEEELQKINKAIAHADDIKDRKDRVIELEARNKELAQLIADIIKKIGEINRFNAAQNKLIEASVNDLFKYVKYRLFYYHQNGEYEPCCVATYNGKTYPDLSDGEKIFVNIDVRNTLGDYYGIDCVLFIDHAESMTMPIEAESQVIRLVAIFVYKCVACDECSYKFIGDDEVPEIVACDHCGANAKRLKELQIEVEQKENVEAA